MGKKRVAFFDIDGTIYRDSLMVEHFRTLIDFRIIEQTTWYEHAKKTYQDWYKRQGDYEDYLEDVSAAYVESLKEITLTDVEFTARWVIRQKADRVYKFTRSRIRYHKENGDLVIFISGSPDFLVKNMAEKYGAIDHAASQYIFDDEVFTGNVIPMWDSKSKNIAIDKFSEKYNLNLEESFAYGDTNGDFSMLKRVGNPIAINPARELLDNIKSDEELSKKALIIVERKDNIYSMKPREIELIEVE